MFSVRYGTCGKSDIVALGPAELAACVIVAVPVYVMVVNLLDVAQEAWWRLWT